VKRILSVTVGFVLLALVLLAPQPVQAKDPAAKAMKEYVQMIGGDLAAKRDSALSALITLSADEAKVFWPIKKEYDAEFKKLIDERLAVLTEFDSVHDRLTPTLARELADRALATGEKRSKLHRTYFDRISKEVSPIVAVQFLQLQGQFETMFDMKLATTVPLAMRN